MLDLSRLSPEQRRAATAPDGPLLIVAGPGSGKTTVLAARIAHLVIDRRVPPPVILALTFTRTAAVHLRLRLAGMLRDRAADVDISTFHSLGLRMVRLWSAELGYGGDRLTVYRESDQRRELERLARQAGLGSTQLDLDELTRATDRLRLDGELAGPAHVRTLAGQYEALLQRRSAVDFTAMLALPLRLFARRPEALRLQQDAYRHLLADEFQDLSGAQYELLRCLSQPHRNLTAVGDPGQRIFSWRGAGPAVLDAFRRDFGDARTITLDENFRSVQRVLAVANRLGHGASGRRMRTANPPGSTPVIYAAADERDEANWVAAQVGRLLAGSTLTPGEVAVLYCAHDQANPLSAALRAAGIPHVVRGPDLDVDDPRPAQDGRASLLCTIHQSKGAEWRVVFLAGCEEGLLPHARAVAVERHNPDQVLEEQRLAYVAITRAREQLYLSWCRTRLLAGTRVRREPSRFLRLLTGELLRAAA